MKRPWVLQEISYARVQEADFEVAVLPLGATEPHNLHLPYGTDIFEATIVGEALCEAAHRAGAKIVLLPTIPYGTESNLQAFPLAMNLQPSTLGRVIADLVESLVSSGIRKIVLLNSHGGNDLKPVLRELYGRSEAHLFLCNWYRVLSDCHAEIFDEPDDHAGEMETSFALAYFPQWVERREDGTLAADEGAARPFRFEALEKGWVGITRPWHLLTTQTGCGNPHAATAEKGEELMRRLKERLVPFLVELSQSPIDAWFPFVPDERKGG